MFWDDILEIKTWLFKLEKKIDATNSKFDHFVENASTAESNLENIEHIIKVLKELISDTFDRDKLDEYMKNVDKFNAMVNEVKGVASMSRTNLHDKNIDGLNRCMKEVLERAENIEKFMDEVNCTLFDILKKMKKKELKKPVKKKKVISLSGEST